ncbi:hypothetical protein OUZ56_032167 [Daphnia magna]|uniref:Uncharacterized protein n=1 Tax=Daphnia magna TaxID=35525 RepID=A0ABQ9ZWC2_9CRUS|nr:hypothetical protein OUZ56_032167 [Daphnia magna]
MSKETVQMAKYVANGSKERVAVMEMTLWNGNKITTTDVQVNSQLAVIIQYWDSETLTSAVHLLDMLVMAVATVVVLVVVCLSNAAFELDKAYLSNGLLASRKMAYDCGHWNY